ncbi:hypothetical protein M3Y99_01819700 [Aphelenchoides fujianensis]|nr:hypothetical protein M3Y99_01819700 [Aphelenchoides fujianensis]
MFPTVKARLEGCDPDALYYVFLDVIPVDAKRYRYVYNKSAWLTAGKAEPHPDSPFSGRQLASQVISFEKAKLTNNEVDRTGHVRPLLPLPSALSVYSWFSIRCTSTSRGCTWCGGSATRSPWTATPVDFNLLGEEYRTFHFAETQFMAVTAYQNQLITKLKIEKNPFAKGFRDPTGRGNDLGDLSRQLENLPRQMFEHPAAAALFLSQCAWPPPPLSAAAGLPPAAAAMSSLFDSTNLPKLLANFPPLPFALPPLLLPPNSTAASSPSSLAKPNGRAAPVQQRCRRRSSRSRSSRTARIRPLCWIPP